MSFWLEVIKDLIALACIMAFPMLLVFYYVAFGGTF
tara:strand:- start:760 stop:867 length:108 start_codon:yes stop_codon:yes gene_type:complete